MLLLLLKVQGHSMEPNFKAGSLVLISNLFFTPRINNVIVFKNSEKLILKRITKVSGSKYQVLGDNKLDSKDYGWIKRDEILGRVILALK